MCICLSMCVYRASSISSHTTMRYDDDDDDASIYSCYDDDHHTSPTYSSILLIHPSIHPFIHPSIHTTMTMFSQRIVEAVNNKRSQLGSEWDTPLRYEAGEVKRRVDPYRTVDLSGYLRIAPFIGGLLYIGLIFIQQALPELFGLAYPAAVAVFTVPIVFIIIFS